MNRLLAPFTLAAGLAAVLTSSCGDSGSDKTNSLSTSAGGGFNAGGSPGDGSIANGGTPIGGGGSVNGGSPSGGGGASAGAGGSPAGGAASGTGGAPPVACTSDGDCASPNPHCDTAGGFCVQCLGDANCPNGETCNTSTHRCVQCATSGDCPNTSPYCDPDGRCVDCLTNDNCAGTNPGGATLVCSQQSHMCVPGCTESSQCQTAFGPARVCDTTTNQCVQCVTAADCNGGGGDAGRPIVCTTQHTCVPGCAADGDCAQNQTRRHCDTTTQLCVQCGTSADCGTNAPYCFTDTGMCVACLTDANCANSGGMCNQQFHVCGACTQTSDCPQGQQCFRGQCF